MQPSPTRTTRARPVMRRAAQVATLAIALTPLCVASAAAGPSPVLLGTAGTYAVLGGSGITNTGVSTIEGDVGSSPTHSEAGFEPCPGGNCVSLTGVNHDVADPNDAVTQQAKSDLQTAYDDAFGRTGGTAISAPLGGGQTLVSGVYTSANDVFVGGDLTLDAAGDPNAVFIFQAKTGALTTAAGIAGGTPNTRVLLTNGAQACNVFWQVGSSATISTYSQFVGTILANQSVTVNTLATLITGRALALNGAVTLDTNTIRKATCATPPGEGEGAGGDTSPGGTPATGTTGTPTVTGALTPALTALLVALTPRPSATAAAPAATPRGTAKMTGPTGAVTGPFTVSVTGRAIAQVVFYVDGRRRTTVRAKSGRTRFSLRINPRRQTRRVHRVTARVTFSTSSRTRDTSIRIVYRRPVAPGSPRFTG